MCHGLKGFSRMVGACVAHSGLQPRQTIVAILAVVAGTGYNAKVPEVLEVPRNIPMISTNGSADPSRNSRKVEEDHLPNRSIGCGNFTRVFLG